MKVTVKTQVEQEFEIETPSYYKVGYCYLKVIDEDKALYIIAPPYECPQIQILKPISGYGATVKNFVDNGVSVTAEEFNQAFCDTHNEISALQLDLLKVA